MFFRREKPRTYTFEEQLDKLRQQGFQVEQTSATSARVARGGCAAHIRKPMEGQISVKVEDVGLLIGGQVALLVELGYQKVWQTPDGKRFPALAEHLHAMHDFSEDLRESLGLESLYNESLGTVNERHLYDRVVGRDLGKTRHPWER